MRSVEIQHRYSRYFAAGNLQLQWAQQTATARLARLVAKRAQVGQAVDTKVLANSYLEAHK